MINIFKNKGLELTNSFHREREKNIKAIVSLLVSTTHLQHRREHEYEPTESSRPNNRQLHHVFKVDPTVVQ